MKVILLNGSPHKEGCTYTALGEVAHTLQKEGIDTDILHLGAGAIQGCTACGSCAALGRCVFQDKVNQWAEAIAQADGLVIGTPVYYAGVSGSLKAALDRLFYSAGARFAGKPGAAVVSARRGGCATAFDDLCKYFTISNMPVAPSQYWNQVHGTAPEEVRQDLEGLQTMRVLGQNMAWLLRCIHLGREQGIGLPSYEKKLRTNFIQR